MLAVKPVISFVCLLEQVGPLPVAATAPCAISTPTQPLRTKLDAKTKTGAVETVELEYSAAVTPSAAYELRLKWVSCGVYIEELKGALTRVARRLGSVHILQVSTVSRYGMAGLDGSDPRFVASWSAPLRVNVCLAGTDVLAACACAEGSILPSGALLRVELALVEKLGMVCDMFDAGKGGVKAPPAATASTGEPSARPSSDSVGPSFICHSGWYRQYVHPYIGCCVRFDGEGVLWIPPLVLAPSGSARDNLRAHFESFLNLCK